MALAEWGLWDATLGEAWALRDVLAGAWLRRERLRARLMAVEMVTALGQALGGPTAGKVSAGEAFALLGVTVPG